MSLGRVLVVDDEKNITVVIRAILERAKYEVIALSDSQEALQILEDEEFDAVITDLYMPGPGGMEILEFAKKNFPHLPVVMITAYGTVETAVNALKAGAYDFITKPFDQADLLNVTQKAVATFHQRQKEPILLQNLNSSAPISAAAGAANASGDGAIESESIIGQSPLMQEVFRVIHKISASNSTVLISGESGTGKELVAYEIHRHSQRKTKPFIKINCAAIPATLIESELFGYEKGAFTGAVSSKPGRFELAHEGTLFLDEVGEMPLEMQVKLLRVLQEQEFERVGGVHTTKVDIRFITATNRNLAEEVKAGRFREDLFYRLNVVPIALPPLRERKEDIEILVKNFLQQFNQKLGKKIQGLEPQTLGALKAYHWPGNIRQLENALERMVLMSDGQVLRMQDIPSEILDQLPKTFEPETAVDAASFKELVKRKTQTVERDLIEKALEDTSGNVTRAAEKLGLSRKGLQLKMKELGLRRE